MTRSGCLQDPGAAISQMAILWSIVGGFRRDAGLRNHDLLCALDARGRMVRMRPGEGGARTRRTAGCAPPAGDFEPSSPDISGTWPCWAVARRPFSIMVSSRFGVGAKSDGGCRCVGRAALTLLARRQGTREIARWLMPNRFQLWYGLEQATTIFCASTQIGLCLCGIPASIINLPFLEHPTSCVLITRR